MVANATSLNIFKPLAAIHIQQHPLPQRKILVSERTRYATRACQTQQSCQHAPPMPCRHALIARGVISDYCEPEVLRFGLAPLCFGYADVWDAVEILKDVLESESWKTT